MKNIFSISKLILILTINSNIIATKYSKPKEMAISNLIYKQNYPVKKIYNEKVLYEILKDAHNKKKSYCYRACGECPKIFSTHRGYMNHIVTHKNENAIVPPDFELEQDYNDTSPIEFNNFNSRLNTIVENLDNLESELGIEKDSFEFKFLTLNSTINKKSKINKRTHAGEKPYKCDQCDKAFAQKGNLKIHKRTHTGEKPYKCDQCDKAFAQKVKLKTHKLTHTGEKPYKCDQCDKAFIEKGSLSRHKLTHTGEKPYKCDQCDKAFTEKNSLKKHKLTHTGEKPYKCNQCDKAFTQKGSLSRHKLTHTDEKPYKCNQCNQSFTTSGNLKRHIKLKHS